MASTSDRHTVELIGKDGLSRAVLTSAKSLDQLDKELKEADRSAKASGASWSDTGKKIGAALGGIGILSSKIAGDAEASSARMEQSFENVGLSVDDFKDKISDLTGKGLKLAFDDEDVQDSLSKLIVTTGDAEKAMRDVGIAEDLARAQGISLASATSIVNAAEAGRFRGLQQLGIQLDANATTEEAIAALQGRVAGQAEAYSKTTAASYERMRNTAENYLESVGGFVNEHAQMALALGGLASAAAPAAEGIRAVSVAAKESAIAGAALDLALGPAGLVLAAGAAAGAIYLWTQRESDAEKATKALKEATDSYTRSLQDETTALANLNLLGTSDQITKLFQSMETGGLEAQSRIDALTQAMTQMNSVTNGTLGFDPEGLRVVLEALGQTSDQIDYMFSLLGPGALDDNFLSSGELSNLLTQLSAGFELTTDQAAQLTTEMQAVQAAMSDPSLYGGDIAAKAIDILNQWHNGAIDTATALKELGDIPIDRTFNRAARAAEEAAKHTYENADAYKYASTEWKASVPVLAAATAAADADTDAIREQTLALIEQAAQMRGDGEQAYNDRIDAYKAQQAAYEEEIANAARANSGLADLSGGMDRATLDASEMSVAIRDLGAALIDTGAEGLNRYMGMIVDSTNAIPDAISKAKEWADALIAPVDTYSTLDTLYKSSSQTYIDAQQAQIDITEDLTRAQTARDKIQIMQAPLIAKQADAAADYIEKISEMTAGEQMLALAYADPATADRITQISDMASEYDSMNSAQQTSFDNMIKGAAAADPALAAVLESLGYITKDVKDPTGWAIGMSVGGQSDVDTLAGSISDLVEMIGLQYGLNIDTNDTGAVARAGLKAQMWAIGAGAWDTSIGIGGDTGGFWAQIRSIPDSVGVRYVDVYERSHSGGAYALGGMSREWSPAALGRMSTDHLTLVGEAGPEVLNLPYGSIVTPHSATSGRGAGTGMSGKGLGGVTFTGPVTFVANNAGDIARNTQPLRRAQARP